MGSAYGDRRAWGAATTLSSFDRRIVSVLQSLVLGWLELDHGAGRAAGITTPLAADTVWRMVDGRWWTEFDAVVAAGLPSGSRVLDLGCGDGGLVDRLTGLGFDAFGVDPNAPAHPRLTRERIENASDLRGFDAITAVMALHHAELDAVVPALTRILRPHGRLFVYDFGWDAYDERAADWLVDHDPAGADHSIAGWRNEHGGLHTIRTIRQALYASFEPSLEVKRPYLARMLARTDLEAEEHALVDAQQLPALGLWYFAERAR